MNVFFTHSATVADTGRGKGSDVLDIQNLRVISTDLQPSDASPTCDVLVVGGGVGGVSAALALARRGVSVILTEPTRSLGGQFTSQLVPVPDENSHIEKPHGPSTASYRALRTEVRAHYAQLPGIKPDAAKNVGQCWVSRVSGTPNVWETVLRAQLDAVTAPNRLRRVYLRHVLRSVGRLANGSVGYADLVDLDTGRVVRIGTRFLLDATEDGTGLQIAGLPTVVGQEAASDYDEPHAPEEARPDWVQSFTYCFAVRYNPNGPGRLVEKPEEYEFFKAQGEYTLDYVYSERGVVTYKVFEPVKGGGGPFWTYRRLLAASSFEGGKSPIGDVSLINWRGNDFHLESYLDKPPAEQVRVLARGKAWAQGFLYWLQNECPRDDQPKDSPVRGYPEMQLVTSGEIPGVGDDGFALHPYIRESHRLKAKFMLTENHLAVSAFPDGAKWGAEFDDSVGCALYAVDIHPTEGEPPLLVNALPYHLPLGAFLTTSGPVNVLPAAKNFGGTRLALASARMHPTEWLVGEITGSLVAFCVRRDIGDPSQVRDNPELLQAFQTNLREGGVALSWREILEN